MAISKTFIGSTKVMLPGEHIVTIVDVNVGKSKKGQPMLTITFENDDGQKIRGYYVKGLDFHQTQLQALKTACGLKGETASDELLALKCGIAVDQNEPTEDGKIFMRIVGYGPAAEVETSNAKAHKALANGPKVHDPLEDIKW